MPRTIDSIGRTWIPAVDDDRGEDGVHQKPSDTKTVHRATKMCGNLMATNAQQTSKPPDAVRNSRERDFASQPRGTQPGRASTRSKQTSSESTVYPMYLLRSKENGSWMSRRVSKSSDSLKRLHFGKIQKYNHVQHSTVQDTARRLDLAS